MRRQKKVILLCVFQVQTMTCGRLIYLYLIYNSQKIVDDFRLLTSQSTYIIHYKKIGDNAHNRNRSILLLAITLTYCEKAIDVNDNRKRCL